jgi:hypothetical protein
MKKAMRLTLIAACLCTYSYICDLI